MKKIRKKEVITETLIKPVLTMLGKTQPSGIEILDPKTKKLLLDNIIDIKKKRELLIFCVTHDPKLATAVKDNLEKENGFKVSYKKQDERWIVEGEKMILINNLEDELIHASDTINLQCCELIKWRVEVDDLKKAK